MVKSEKIVVWGASGHALVVTDILELRGEYEIAGYIDEVNPERKGESFGNAHILGGRECLDALRAQGIANVVVAVGDCSARLELTGFVSEAGFTPVSAVHPQAVVARSAVIGPGTVVAGGCVINPATAIGQSVIVNTGATVDHECVIGDSAHIGPGSHLAARVTVGRATFIGVGTTVKDRVRIGEHCVVGAGSVVIQDLPHRVVAYGVPARVVRSDQGHQEQT